MTAFNEMPADSLRHRTDQEMYELVLEVSARYLTPSQLDILRCVNVNVFCNISDPGSFVQIGLFFLSLDPDRPKNPDP